MRVSLPKAETRRRQQESRSAQDLIRGLYSALEIAETRLAGSVDGDDLEGLISNAIRFLQRHHGSAA
jgi:hypothetical protein